MQPVPVIIISGGGSIVAKITSGTFPYLFDNWENVISHRSIEKKINSTKTNAIESWLNKESIQNHLNQKRFLGILGDSKCLNNQKNSLLISYWHMDITINIAADWCTVMMLLTDMRIYVLANGAFWQGHCERKFSVIEGNVANSAIERLCSSDPLWSSLSVQWRKTWNQVSDAKNHQICNAIKLQMILRSESDHLI